MTKTKDVPGIYYNGNNNFSVVMGNVTVRFTRDKKGETLSFTFDDKHQISVPFESIKDMVLER